jgi:hypothetical protein
MVRGNQYDSSQLQPLLVKQGREKEDVFSNVSLFANSQTVKFGLCRECMLRTEILAEFLSTHFQENHTKSA